MQLLPDYGADVNSRSGKYGNALQAAIAWDRLKSAELLLSRGAKLYPPGKEWDDLLSMLENWNGLGVRRLR